MTWYIYVEGSDDDRTNVYVSESNYVSPNELQEHSFIGEHTDDKTNNHLVGKKSSSTTEEENTRNYKE